MKSSLKRISLIGVTATILFVIGMLAFGFQANKAYAAQTYNVQTSSCNTNDNLSQWDWPQWVASSNGGDLTNFSHSGSSWAIFGQYYGQNANGTNVNVWELITPENQADSLVYSMTSDGHEHLHTLQNGTMYGVALFDEYTPGVSANGYPNASVKTSFGTDIDLNNQSSWSGVWSSGFSPYCMSGQNNIYYDSTFTDPEYLNFGTAYTGGKYGPGQVNSCASGLSGIPCEIGKYFTGVADDILSAIQALAGFIGDIFLPNGQQLNADWSSFSSNMQNHLGFLLWPFTFIGDLYNALITPSSSDCVLHGATFFGTTAPNIDLCAPETSLGNLWTYTTYLVRAVLILGLFFFLKNKFQEIVSK